MSMVAGCKAMELYDRAAHDRLAALGEHLREGLRDILQRTGRPGQVTGAASMVGLFHTDAPMGEWRSTLKMMMENPDVMQTGDAFFREMLNEGVYMASQGFFVLSTPMHESDIDFILDKAEKVLTRLTG
jgi:glutamate-1-semialdehyde aminotransferase